MARPPGPEGDSASAALADLQRVTDAALASLSLDELLPELLERITRILDADTAAILLLEEGGHMLRARAAKGIEQEVERGVRIPVGGGFAGRIAAERRAVAIEDVDHADILNPILRERGIRSLLGVPLLTDDDVIGVLHVGSLVPRTFTDEQRDLLQLAADRASTAIAHARYDEQRHVATALQRSLLPHVLPELPGLELAARYRPGTTADGVGGDWYDVFELDRGQVALVIGDVVGRGIPAAALMAQLRTALRAYAYDGHAPADVVDRLNRLCAHVSRGTMTTLVYLVMDPTEEAAIVVNAGHLPPLLVAPDGEARYLAIDSDLPLGVSQSARYGEHRLSLPTDSTIVLFTDGAVEVRGESVDDGLVRLRHLAAHETSTQRICDGIMGGVAGSEGGRDDIALLIARTLPLEEHLTTSWPAEAEALAPLRVLLRRWLRLQGADEAHAFDITVACQEACANAVEHAYAPGPAAFEVDLSHRAGEIEIVVRDRGQWREARGVHRGRGLGLMRALMDEVEVRRREGGTEVVLRRRLRLEADAA